MVSSPDAFLTGLGLDLQADDTLNVLTDVWWILGNHDTDSDPDHDNLFGAELAHRNLHGRVVEIAGVRVAGLGGIFRESIWSPLLEPAYRSAADRLKIIHASERWRDGLPRRHRSSPAICTARFGRWRGVAKKSRWLETPHADEATTRCFGRPPAGATQRLSPL